MPSISLIKSAISKREICVESVGAGLYWNFSTVKDRIKTIDESKGEGMGKRSSKGGYIVRADGSRLK